MVKPDPRGADRTSLALPLCSRLCSTPKKGEFWDEYPLQQTRNSFDLDGLPYRTWISSQTLCTDESALGEIRVRILDRQLKHYLPDAVFGFAIPPVWATVYYEPAQRLAQSATGTESNVPVILSCLIAHEIGHLLLGQNAHAVDGIMRARWEVWQIQEVLKGGLGFLPEESKVMLRNAQERTRPLNTSLSDQPASPMVEQRRPD